MGKLIDIVEHLEEIQQQANFNYKIGVDNLEATNKTVSSKKQFEWLDTSFMKLLIALNEFNENIQNENIKLPKITANTPTRLMPPSYE